MKMDRTAHLGVFAPGWSLLPHPKLYWLGSPHLHHACVMACGGHLLLDLGCTHTFPNKSEEALWRKVSEGGGKNTIEITGRAFRNRKMVHTRQEKHLPLME